MKGRNVFGVEVDADALMKAVWDAQDRDMERVKKKYDQIPQQDKVGVSFEDYVEQYERLRVQIQSLKESPGFFVWCEADHDDPNYKIPAIEGDEFPYIVHIDNGDMDVDVFRTLYVVEEGADDYLMSQLDSIEVSLGCLGHGLATLVQRKLEQRLFGIRFREIEAGKIPRFGIFLWQNTFYTVEGELDGDYRFEARRIASGWTMNPYDRWQRADGLELFNGYCQVQELLFVQGEN